MEIGDEVNLPVATKISRILKGDPGLGEPWHIIIDGVAFEYGNSNLKDLCRETIAAAEISPKTVFVGSNWYIENWTLVMALYPGPLRESSRMDREDLAPLFLTGKVPSEIWFCRKCGNPQDGTPSRRKYCEPCEEVN